MIRFNKSHVNWTAVVIGIIIFGLQLPLLPSTVDFVKSSKVVTGEVVRLNAGGKHPQVEFITLRGERVSVPASSWFHFAEIGDKVEMRYDPKNSHDAQMNTFFGIWGVHLMFCWVALMFLFGGILGFPHRRSRGNLVK